MEQCFPFGISYGRVINVGPQRGLRFEVVQKIRIHRQILGQGAPHGHGIIGIDARAAEIGQIIFGEVSQYAGSGGLRSRKCC